MTIQPIRLGERLFTLGMVGVVSGQVVKIELNYRLIISVHGLSFPG